MLKEFPDHSAHAPSLITTQGRPVPLTGIHADVTITELLMETTLKQTFVNAEDVAIEAVYTFAVPVDAVLLGLTLRIGDQDLLGMVLDAEQAQENYEDVLLEGDGAGLLEQAADGLMTLSVGNLLPGQTIRQRCRSPLMINSLISKPDYDRLPSAGVVSQQTTQRLARKAFSLRACLDRLTSKKKSFQV